jgi:hypothetical protein
MVVGQSNALKSISNTNRQGSCVGDGALAAAGSCPNTTRTRDGRRRKCGRLGKCKWGGGRRVRRGVRKWRREKDNWTIGLMILALIILRFHPYNRPPPAATARMAAPNQNQQQNQRRIRKWTTNPLRWNTDGGPIADLVVGNLRHQEIAAIFQPWWPEGAGVTPGTVPTTAHIHWMAIRDKIYEAPVHQWPHEPLSGDVIIFTMDTLLVQLTAGNFAGNSHLGACIMDVGWTELGVRLGLYSTTVEYKAVPNESYRLLPVDWSGNATISGFNAVNFGNLMETAAGTAVLAHRETGLNFVRQLLFATACCDPEYQKRFGLEIIRHNCGANLPQALVSIVEAGAKVYIDAGAKP